MTVLVELFAAVGGGLTLGGATGVLAGCIVYGRHDAMVMVRAGLRARGKATS